MTTPYYNASASGLPVVQGYEVGSKMDVPTVTAFEQAPGDAAPVVVGGLEHDFQREKQPKRFRDIIW
jgi:hypothetical protein